MGFVRSDFDEFSIDRNDETSETNTVEYKTR